MDESIFNYEYPTDDQQKVVDEYVNSVKEKYSKIYSLFDRLSIKGRSIEQSRIIIERYIKIYLK